MATPLQTLRQVRLDKLAKIRELGVDPYPARANRQQTIAEARKMIGKLVAVAGRVMAIRGHGGIQFMDLRDESGQIQLVFRKENLQPSNLELLTLLDIGDFIDATGKVFKTKAGEISIQVEEFNLLTKAIRPLPSTWHGLKDVEERYRQRYIDLLLNPPVRNIFIQRSRILSTIREFLDENGFLEVETPVLQPIHGGASARPFVTHHRVLDRDLYLRISDELYLKRLIVGGFEKVYEVSKDFRNEGIDRTHNPEFTQVEFYWAYADYEDLMTFTEKMLANVLKTVFGGTKISTGEQTFDFSPPLPRLSFRDVLLEKTGIDTSQVTSEKSLIGEIISKKIKIDIKEAVGLGAIYDKLYKEEIRPEIIAPSFLTDYPTSMIALAKRREDDPQKIASFQLLANGTEIIKAYNELNDPQDQKARWLESEKLAKQGNEEAERLDEDYIRALEYGMPPTAGWGMGIDRLTALLTGTPLKEVILFPTLKPEK